MRAIHCVGSAVLALVAACKGKQEPPRPVAEDAAPRAIDASLDASVACVPRGELRATAVDQGVRICGAAACVDVDAAGTLHSTPLVTIPNASLTAATVEARGKKFAACYRDKCRDLGKKATDLVVRNPDVKPAATTDLALLVLPKTLWSIADDKEVALRGPGGEKELASLRAIGTNVLAVWAPPVEAMYARDGRLLASLFSSGTQLAMLDDTTSVALTPDHRVFVFADETRQVELVPSVGFDDWVKEAGALAVLPDKTVAVVLVRAGGEASVILIDPLRATVFRRWPLSLCPG